MTATPPLENLARLLEERMPGRVLRHHPLAPHTTYGIGGPADLALFPGDPGEVSTAVEAAARAGVPLLVLGGGSNVLVSDAGVRGAVLFTTGLSSIEVRGAELVAGAGAASDAVSRAALAAGLEGAEFLTRLPGTIGGACYMNARAYGGEVSSVLDRVRAVDPRSGVLSALSTREQPFAYKRSPFMASGALLVEAVLALRPAPAETIAARVREIEARRAASRELDFPSCGCVFKNDERFGAPSGKLIEGCGLRGLRLGRAQVSPHHANFVINLGGATADEVRRLIEQVRDTVASSAGFTLELEVRLVGEWG
jgi:UDP-N-acetylmuramate dehydrogenase